MKRYELERCGTVMSMDLTVDKDFGHIVVELVPDQIKRMIDIIYDLLPDKTPADKKCKEFLNTRLLPGGINTEINIIPVFNKTAMKKRGSYKLSKPRLTASPTTADQ